ncbi:unnamed protein product [Closterium sp. NIES-53]
MVHAAAPHFLSPFAVRYAAHQLNLWPRVSLSETSPTLRWTGEVGDASVFRVWGSRTFVRDTTADKLSACAVPCVFLGFVPDAPGWQFYHPTSRRVFPSQDVTFDESVPFYRLFPYRTAPLPPPPLFLAPGTPQVEPLPAPSPAPSGVSQVDPPLLTALVEVTSDSGPAEGGPARGAASGVAEPGGAEPGGAEPGSTESGGAAPGGGEASGEQSPWSGRLRSRSAGASPLHSRRRLPLSPQQLREWYVNRQGRAAGAGGPAAGGAGVGVTGVGAVPLSPQQLREWYVSRQGRAAGARGPAAGGAGAGDSATGVVSTGVPRAAGPRGARSGGTGAAGTGGPAGPGGAAVDSEVGGPGTGGASSGGATAGGTRAGGPGVAAGAGAGGSGAVGGAGAGGAGAGGFGAAACAGAGGSRAVGGAGAGGAGAGGSGAAAGAGAGGSGAVGGAGAGGAGAGGSGAAGGAGATGAGGTAPPLLFFAPPSPSSLPPPGSVLRHVLSLLSSTGLPLQPGSPLPAPSPYTELTGGLPERHQPASRPVSPFRTVRTGRTGRRVPRERPPAVPGTHLMALRPSSASQRVPLLSPPASSLHVVADPESDRARAALLLSRLVDFAAACRLDYAAILVAESESVRPLSVEGECALGTDVLEDRQEDLECLATAAPHLVSMLLAPEGDPDALDIPALRSYAEAIAGEYSSQWQTAMDAEMASWKSTGTYINEVPPPGANIVDGMWIFRVKRPPGSLPVFKARYVARGFSQRKGVDFFQTFSPTPKMTTLRVLLHEIWLRRPPGFTGSFPPGTQWSLQRPVYGLRQAPREWHDTLRTTLAALGFAPSTADPSLFLRTDTLLPLFYILVYITRDRARRTITLTQSHLVQQVLQRFGFTWSSAQPTPLATGHSLSAPPSDESVEPSGPYPELVGCLMYRMTCTRPDLAYPLGLLASYVAPGQHRKELRWLPYQLNDLGERPRSPPVLYVDNKAAISLCQEHRLDHRMKHIAQRYFLARELQQRGQLRLAHVATRANTANIFTKALPSGDHQRFCTLLGLMPTFPHLL